MSNKRFRDAAGGMPCKCPTGRDVGVSVVNLQAQQHSMGLASLSRWCLQLYLPTILVHRFKWSVMGMDGQG